jgi:arylsulfatase A-like enzyme
MSTDREALGRGAARGGVAWGAYAVVETTLAMLSAWWTDAPEVRTLPHAGFSALVLVTYPLLGALLGAGAAGLIVLLRRVSRVLSRGDLAAQIDAGALGSLIAVLLASLVLHAGSSLDRLAVALVVDVLLAGVLLLAALSPTRAARLRFATRPWSVAVVLATLPWLAVEVLAGSPWMRGAILLLAAAAILAVSLAVRPAERGSGATLLLLGVVLAAGFVLPRPTPPGAADAFAGEAGDADLPHVILITLDTVRADHLSVYGYDRATTPFLERFAEEATLYTRAFASGAMTLSTHASIFTGLYVSRHGAHNAPYAPGGAPLAEGVPTLAEALTDAGYATLGVASNVGYLSPDFGLDRGFLHYDSRPPVRFLELGKRYQLRRAVRNVLSLLGGGDRGQKWYRTADEINEVVFPLLERAAASRRPLHLFLNYMDAHDPYVPEAPFDTRFPGKADEIDPETVVENGRAFLRGEHTLTRREREHMTSQYDGEIAYLDSRLELLFDRLRELGLYDSSLIVITSDHGEAFGENDLVHHGVSVYQDQVFVPLIVKYPGAVGPSVVDTPVSVVDVMPTVLEAVGAPAADGIDGTSLRAAANGDASTRLLISESYPAGDLVELSPKFDRVERAAYAGRLKLIVSSAGKRELYDFAADMAETRDLIDLRSSDADALEARLTGWLDGVVVEIERATELDQDARDRLEALGYVQ